MDGGELVCSLGLYDVSVVSSVAAGVAVTDVEVAGVDVAGGDVAGVDVTGIDVAGIVDSVSVELWISVSNNKTQLKGYPIKLDSKTFLTHSNLNIKVNSHQAKANANANISFVDFQLFSDLLHVFCDISRFRFLFRLV